MENKSFNFDLQLFAAKTWTLDLDGNNVVFKSGNTTASGATLVEALTALGTDLGEGDTINLTKSVDLGSGLLDFKKATLNLSGTLDANKYYLNASGGGEITIKNVTINNSTSNTANNGGDSINVEANAVKSLVLDGVTINETKTSSAIRTYNYTGTVSLKNSTINTTGDGCSLFFDGGLSEAKVTMDSNTTITSSKTGNKQIIWLDGSSTMTSAATIVDKISYSNTDRGSVAMSDDGAKFTMNGGSYSNLGAGNNILADVYDGASHTASTGSFLVKSGELTLKEGSIFVTDNATYTVKSAGTSGATVTMSVNGTAETATTQSGSFDVVAKGELILNGVKFAKADKTIVATEAWYDYATYKNGFASDSDASTKGWYFTALPAKVDSSTSGIVFNSGSGTVSGTVASDATITFSSAVKSGDVKLTLQGDAKVSKIVNGTETLVAGSFEIGEDHTLIFGADLSSEESSDDSSTETSDDSSTETSDDSSTETSDDSSTETSDDSSTETSDDSSTETSDDSSTETSDESGETSDESGETSDESGETSDESGETSDESGETSDESGETSDESGETSDESGETSDETSGETSDESGETSDESGETSDESGETSDESGETSDESGETSDESSDTSDESGETSDDSGETSDESGETSDDSSSDTSDETSGDDTTDDTEEAESFIKDLADGEVQDMTDQSSVTLGKGDLASVPADAFGTKTINMGDDAAYVSIAKGTKAKVNINLGAGENFVSNGGTNTAIDFSAAGKTKVALGEGSHADFNNYDWKSGAGIATSADTNILNTFYAALAGKLASLLAAFSFGTTASNDVLDDLATGTDTNDADAKSAYVNLYYGESYNKNVVMGMTGSGDSYINTNENDTLRDEPIVLVGNYTNNVSGTASLISGSGNDGVFAGDGDTVDAGTGTNNIYLNTTGTSAKGTTIMMTSGDNFVTGMDNNDGIITEAGVEVVTAEDGNMVFRNDDGGITTIVDGADGVSAYNVRAAGVDYSAVAGTNKVAYNGVSNYYNASKQNASITASTSSAEIWLNKDVARSYGYTNEFIGDFKYINAAGVSGRTTLAGDAGIDNVITAGSGASSAWGGGASDDTLIAGKGSNTFFYMKGDGNDSIRGADDYDTVRIEGGMTLADITKIDVSNTAVALEFSDGGSLTLNSNNGTKFKIDGATYTYDKSAGDWQKS